MKISEAFPSQFLKAVDLQGRTVKATISMVKSEDIGGDQKPVVYFNDKERGLVLNKTNAATIVMAFGDDTDGWQGATIELFPQAVAFQGQMVPAIRVRVPAEPAKPQNGGATFVPNAANRPAATAKYDERNPPPAEDMDVPF